MTSLPPPVLFCVQCAQVKQVCVSDPPRFPFLFLSSSFYFFFSSLLFFFSASSLLFFSSSACFKSASSPTPGLPRPLLTHRCPPLSPTHHFPSCRHEWGARSLRGQARGLDPIPREQRQPRGREGAHHRAAANQDGRDGHGQWMSHVWMSHVWCAGWTVLWPCCGHAVTVCCDCAVTVL